MSEVFALDSPAQIMTAHEFERRRSAMFTTGEVDGIGFEGPRVVYADPVSGEPVVNRAVILEAWPFEEAQKMGRMSRRELRGDDSHRDGCGSGAYRDFERASCGTCALRGYGAHSDSGYPAPNHAGWARIYVQANEAIPRAWLPAFMAALNDRENDRYREALRRDVATVGYRVTDAEPGYRLPVPSPEALLRYLEERHEGDRAAILEEATAIALDEDGEHAPADRRAALTLARRLEAQAAVDRG